MAVGDAYVFPGFFHTSINTQFSFERHRLLFSRTSTEVRSENTPESKLASTGCRTHNHQVMSPTRLALYHPSESEVGGRANDGVGHGSIDNLIA